jgi:hypothetical protein
MVDDCWFYLDYISTRIYARIVNLLNITRILFATGFICQFSNEYGRPINEWGLYKMGQANSLSLGTARKNTRIMFQPGFMPEYSVNLL